MRTLLLATMAISALTLASQAPAQAQGGCGPYAHRGYDGYCHPNGWRPRPPVYGYGYRYGYGYGYRPHFYGPGYGFYRHW